MNNIKINKDFYAIKEKIKEDGKDLYKTFKSMYEDKDNKSKLKKLLINLSLIPIVIMISFVILTLGLIIVTSTIASLVLFPFMLWGFKISGILNIVLLMGIQYLLFKLFILLLRVTNKAYDIYMYWLKTDELRIKEFINVKKIKKNKVFNFLSK